MVPGVSVDFVVTSVDWVVWGVSELTGCFGSLSGLVVIYYECFKGLDLFNVSM